MTPKESAEDWLRMYRSITDKDEIEKSKRKESLKKYIEEKKKDTGAYVV